MAKSNGLGDNFYVGQYNVSGDIASLNSISSSVGVLDVTGIDKYAFERLAGVNTGQLDFTTHFNPAAARQHVALSAMPSTDVQVSYFHNTALGNRAASMISKQISYDGTRGNDGGLSFNVSTVSNGYGIEWGKQLTAGIRTDTTATDGTSIDTLASASFGAQAYLHVTAFTGTDVTIKIQDSADDVSFADVTSLTFGAISAVGTSRIAIGSTATVRRYVRVVTTTSAGFTTVSFAVNLVKNALTTQF